MPIEVIANKSRIPQPTVCRLRTHANEDDIRMTSYQEDLTKNIQMLQDIKLIKKNRITNETITRLEDVDLICEKISDNNNTSSNSNNSYKFDEDEKQIHNKINEKMIKKLNEKGIIIGADYLENLETTSRFLKQQEIDEKKKNQFAKIIDQSKRLNYHDLKSDSKWKEALHQLINTRKYISKIQCNSSERKRQHYAKLSNTRRVYTKLHPTHTRQFKEINEIVEGSNNYGKIIKKKDDDNINKLDKNNDKKDKNDNDKKNENLMSSSSSSSTVLSTLSPSLSPTISEPLISLTSPTSSAKTYKVTNAINSTSTEKVRWALESSIFYQKYAENEIWKLDRELNKITNAHIEESSSESDDDEDDIKKKTDYDLS